MTYLIIQFTYSHLHTKRTHSIHGFFLYNYHMVNILHFIYNKRSSLSSSILSKYAQITNFFLLCFCFNCMILFLILLVFRISTVFCLILMWWIQSHLSWWSSFSSCIVFLILHYICIWNLILNDIVSLRIKLEN